MNESTIEIEARAKNEAEFHDARIKVADESRLSYAYASVGDVYEFSKVPRECWLSTILEIGCFRGEQAVALNEFTGKYIGIDISSAAVDYCKTIGLRSNFVFRVDDANALATIADGSIDYAFGDGVLHHLDLARFAPSLSRKLAPSGYARFIEPAQGNFILRAFRKLTPQLRTPDERPFDRFSIELLEKYFDVRISYHGLLRPCIPMMFLNSKKVTDISRWAEGYLLRSRLLQKQAWLLQIELRNR